MDDTPLTKTDLEQSINHAIDRLKVYIVERDMKIALVFVGLQITYFFGTLAAVWFMLAHYKP